MQLTTEENERAAYAANNTPLATAWGRIIDLENQACELRDLLRDASATLSQCLPVINAHRLMSGGDGDISAMNARVMIDKIAAAVE
jgi:hypothetical protein